MAVDRYFACTNCKVYINAGDRWAYWTLEDAGVLAKGAPISADALSSARAYWYPEEVDSANWCLDELLPTVRSFLAEHTCHRIVFGDKDDFMFGDAEHYWDAYFNWMAEGWAAVPTVRMLVEKLHLRTWEEVCDYVRESPPSWMGHDMRDAARKKFEELVGSGSAL